MATRGRDRNVGALILIALGVILLLGQFGMQLNFNWWAIFIALPGLAMLRNVYNVYTANNRLNNNDLVQGGLGLFLVVLALAFLFNVELDWLFKLWPLALVAIGLAMIFGRRES